jgi:hypothetical protein
MGAKHRTYLAALLSLVFASTACGGGPVSPGDIRDQLTEQIETQSVIFRFSAGDSVDTGWQQSYHDWVTGLLGVQMPTKLKYYKYTGRAQMKSVTGTEANGFAEPEVYAVHTIFPRDGHESTHVCSALVGRPSDFFNEGLAVALNTEPGAGVFTSQWNGTHVYAHTQLLIRTRQLRPLGPMLATDAFRAVDEWTAYGEAGSFVLYLIEQHGIGAMLSFFGMSSRGDSRASIESNLRAVWGEDLATLEADWLAFIDGWSG